MIVKQIGNQTGISITAIKAVLSLFEEGATVPFIARYRKERTGSLDEVQITEIQQALERLQKLEKRKDSIIEAISEQGQLNDKLKNSILNCWDTTQLEDIYLPFKRSRKTKADTARENGLEPLAKIISAQRSHNLHNEARRFVRGKIKSVDEALDGSRHIISGWMNENISMRASLRSIYERSARLESKVIAKKKSEADKYKLYFDFNESLHKCPSHRLLAIYRGENEGFLRVKISIDNDRAHDKLARYYIKSTGDCADQIDQAIKDALTRLILPSIENEYKKIAKEKADTDAIDVFVKNLRQLLLASPLGSKPVLAIDPGFRTGCKVVVLDRNGTLHNNSTIYPHPPQSSTEESAAKIRKWINKYNVRHIAIGNGTAGRETYQFLQSIGIDAEMYMVNENGASIYSASAIAREEFPDFDLTVRGAISIGRRLMDPLAELVKIDAKSIGVGQYQHDVNQAKLKESLDRTVVSCVNTVGINLNTASKHLLQYVSGIGPSVAENIVKYRDHIGQFTKREQLLAVPRMGKKAFEQAAGFLRIKHGAQPLDNTGVHPERYKLVKTILKENGITMAEGGIQSGQVKEIDLNRYISDDIGLPTLTDIISELQKPGLDTRGAAKAVQFSAQIKTIEDLKIGGIMSGIVNNLTKFGAFVDLGIKESGLIHISQITNRFIKDPSEVLSLNQEVEVKIVDVDIQRKRVSLTMKF